MKSKRTLSRPAAALLIIVCSLLIIVAIRGDRGRRSPESAQIRETYAGYALTFPEDAAAQSLTELLTQTPYEEVTGDKQTWKEYDAEAFAPYLPLAETVSSVQSSPFNSEVVTYIRFSADGQEFCQCYKGDTLTNQTVYDPASDTAYEITDKKVTVYDNFSETAANAGKSTSLFDLDRLFGRK
ncbi:MAG: hypothetical protein ACI4PD_01855 [Butyricicoccus sp.]